MRMCEPEFALDNVWHVLDVLEGSPAESAGLVPYGDWIIGWSGGVLSAEGDFYDVVEAACVSSSSIDHHSLNFESYSTSRSPCGYTYTHMISSKFISARLTKCVFTTLFFLSTIREVVLVPNRHWGGEGLLGCVFGYVFRFPN